MELQRKRDMTHGLQPVDVLGSPALNRGTMADRGRPSGGPAREPRPIRVPEAPAASTRARTAIPGLDSSWQIRPAWWVMAIVAPVAGGLAASLIPALAEGAATRPGIAWAFLTALTIGYAALGIVMLAQYRATSDSAYRALGNGFLIAAGMAPWWLAASGTAYDSGEPLLGGPSSALYFWLLSTTVVVLALGVGARRFRRRKALLARAAEGRMLSISPTLSGLVSLLLGTLGSLLLVGASQWLPELVSSGGTAVNGPALVGLLVTVWILAAWALVQIWPGLRRRSHIHRWMAYLLAAMSLAVFWGAGSALGFAGGWYGGRAFEAIAVLCALILLVAHLMGLQRQLEKQVVAAELQRGRADRAQRDLYRIATTDRLTGLPNRAGFAASIERILTEPPDVDRASPQPGWDGEEHRRRRPPSGSDTALVLVELNRFKEINDSFGDDVGDEVLVATARRLRRSVRSGDNVFRLGGDEFALVLHDVPPDPETIQRILTPVLERIESPIHAHGISVSASCSIAAALRGRKRIAAGLLQQRANVAMHAAKSDRAHRIVVFDETMERDSRRRQENLAAMQRGVDRGEFTYHFQPIIDLRSEEVWGVETLLRWERDGKVLAAGAFIEDAEETGIIRRITARTLERLHSALPRLLTSLGPEGVVTFNLSVLELSDARLIDDLVAEEWAGARSRMVIEVTEGAMLEHDSPATQALNRLRAVGFRLAVDDLGSGWSNFGTLGTIRPSLLKIDRQFVHNKDALGHGYTFVRAAAVIGESINATTLAEGLESRAQMVAVRNVGIRLGQGFGIARPLPLDELLAWLPVYRQQIGQRPPPQRRAGPPPSFFGGSPPGSRPSFRRPEIVRLPDEWPWEGDPLSGPG